MEEENIYSIILRHDTSTQWMVNDPILALSEYGVEDDTHRVKRGNGESKWSELLYEDFGLSYLLTFDNISGDAKENQSLKEALNERVSKDTFKDVGNGVITGLNVVAENGFIGKITKRTTDVSSSATSLTNMYIVSNDHSIQGYWTVDELGAQILDLRGNTTIEDYTPGHMYYSDQMCFHNNKLYRAIANFTATETFNAEQWVIITSLLASDIKYDNKTSGLESKTVKDAIDELQDLDNEKLQKTKRANKVYGTSESGEQYLYDLEELRKVDTVNGAKADAGRNVQIDGTMINVDDSVTAKHTIKQALETKVNKDVAGVGEKIIKDFALTYSDIDGSINVIKTKLSLENGDVEEQTQKINVASNAELDTVKAELNETITNTKQELNAKIEASEQSLTTKLEDGDAQLDTKIDETKQQLSDGMAQINAELTQVIDVNKSDINNRVDKEVATINKTIEQNVQDINNSMTQGLSQKIDKALADSLVSDISVATESSEPTLKITSKNTDTKTEIVKHLHFTKNGNIELKAENDHIIVDTTAIDTKIADNLSHLGVVDTRLASHDSQLRSMNNDLDVHSEHLANIDAELAEVDRNLSVHQLHLEKTDADVKALETKHDNVVTDLKATDAKFATDLVLVNEQLDVHTTQLQNQSDTIVSITDVVNNNKTNIETNATNIAANAQAIAKNAQDIETNAQAIAQNDRNIGRNAEKIAENMDAIEANNQAIIRNEVNITANQQAIETNTGAITELQNNKADKTFASVTNNNVVGSLKLATMANNEILVLDNISVSPVDGTSSESKIKVISSDNTVVARTVTDDNGNITAIDLATNLDVDVHYFFTSATLNKTIPSDNTISFDSLTNTTAPTDIQVKDIVSDSDGTWARVQEVDTVNKTIKCVTFHNQTRAVWGSIDGTLANQQDLKAELDAKINQNIASAVVTGFNITSSGLDRDDLDQIKFSYTMQPTNGTGGHTSGPAVIAKSESLHLTKGTGTNPVTYKFKVMTEGVDFDAKESGLTSTKLGNAIRELKALDDDKLLITTFNNFETEYASYKTSVTQSLTDLENTIDGKLADLETSVTENITPKIAEIEKSVDASSETITEINNQLAQKVVKSTTANIVYGTDASGNQTTYNKTEFGKVDTINGLNADSNKNILITAKDIPYTENSIDYILSGATDIETALNNAREDLKTLYDMFAMTQQVWDLDGMMATQSFDVPIKTNDFFTASSVNGVVLMAKIVDESKLADFTEFSRGIDYIRAGVESDGLELVGIPEQIEDVVLNVMMSSILFDSYIAEDENPHCTIYDSNDNIVSEFDMGGEIDYVSFNNDTYVRWAPELALGTPDDYLDAGVQLRVSITASGDSAQELASLQCSYVGSNAPEAFKDYMVIDRLPA